MQLLVSLLAQGGIKSSNIISDNLFVDLSKEMLEKGPPHYHYLINTSKNVS